MFPAAFADAVVDRYSEPGDTVLDPFAGRGTTLYSAATTGRNAVGVEINPVGWVYSKTKLNPAPHAAVLQRAKEIGSSATLYREEARSLPVFFQKCFSKSVLQFLIGVRTLLDWRRNDVDRTLMAFILIHLHGKVTDSLSNQMRQTKAMSPQYAVRWWRERDFRPPNLDPVEFISRKLQWRYAKGTPRASKSVVLLGDSAVLLTDLRSSLGRHRIAPASLMLTSPPYFGITNYHYDQWIRLWLLGGPPTDRRSESQFQGKHQGKFANVSFYRDLLSTVFAHSAGLLRREAVIYVRTDRREPTLTITRDVLREVFPSHRLRRANRPALRNTQTDLFGHYDPRFGDVDFILTT